MKQLLKRLVLLASVLLAAGALLTQPAFSAHPWSVTISDPESPTHNKSFLISYTAFSTVASDSINVELFRGASSLGSQTTTEPYGDSGSFSVTVPSDGTYSFHIEATNGSETKSSNTVSVKVDSNAPSTPQFVSKNHSGNHWTVNFKTANDGQTSKVRVYSSTSRNFTANSSTLDGVVSIGPNQNGNLTVTSAAERFFAVQAVDNANNVSGLDSEPTVFVTQSTGEAGSTGARSSGGAAGTATATGSVLGAHNQNANAGQSDQADTANQAANSAGQVAGASTFASQSRWDWLLAVLVVAGLGLLVWRRRRETKNPAS